jgi:hypothetical protein
VLASDIVDYRSAADYVASAYLKLFRERVILFDDDKNGILLRGITGNVNSASIVALGIGLIGNFSSVSLKPPFMFPEPIVFNEGEELNVYLTTIAGAAVAASTLAVADTEVALISSVERV